MDAASSPSPSCCPHAVGVVGPGFGSLPDWHHQQSQQCHHCQPGCKTSNSLSPFAAILAFLERMFTSVAVRRLTDTRSPTAVAGMVICFQLIVSYGCFIQWRLLNNVKHSSYSIYKVHKNYITVTSRISLDTISANQHCINDNEGNISQKHPDFAETQISLPVTTMRSPHNSLDFCPASIKSLGCFYFRCVLSSQWKAMTVNLRILHRQL